MADTGAPYFIPYVEPTDLVRDYPAANEAMALAIVAALEDIPVTIKKVDAFTGSGTFTVPAGVTYAIAHMLGGGGGVGTTGAGSGVSSRVFFPSGTRQSLGGRALNNPSHSSRQGSAAGQNNSGRGAAFSGHNAGTTQRSYSDMALSATYVVAGAPVTPAASITVQVGAGGSAGSNGAAGGSGYVYIEYFEEV